MMKQGRRRRSGRSGHGRTTFSAAHANFNLRCEQSIPKLWLSSGYLPLVIPATNTTSERFSAPRGVGLKTYLRSAMTPTRLNTHTCLCMYYGENRRSRPVRNRKRVHCYRNEGHRCVFTKF